MPLFNWDNPNGWIFKVEQYFSYYNLSNDQRFIISSIHMDGTSLSLYQLMKLNKQLTSWVPFKTSLLKWFGTSLHRDLSSELEKLHQT